MFPIPVSTRNFWSQLLKLKKYINYRVIKKKLKPFLF